MGVTGWIGLVVAAWTAWPSLALVEKTQILHANAFFVQNSDDGLFQSLDLKRQHVEFKQADITACAKHMVRVKDTLHFTCVLELPTHAPIVKRQTQITPVVMLIPYANQSRKVYITVSADAKTVSYSTEFDMVAFDLDAAKFNDDFYNIYAQSAVNIIGEAMKKTLNLEILESHNKHVAQLK